MNHAWCFLGFSSVCIMHILLYAYLSKNYLVECELMLINIVELPRFRHVLCISYLLYLNRKDSWTFCGSVQRPRMGPWIVVRILQVVFRERTWQVLTEQHDNRNVSTMIEVKYFIILLWLDDRRSSYDILWAKMTMIVSPLRVEKEQVGFAC